MPEVRPFFQKAMLLSEVGWNTPPFLTMGSEEPNDFLSPGSEMKWTPLHLGNQRPGPDTYKIDYLFYTEIGYTVQSFENRKCIFKIAVD